MTAGIRTGVRPGPKTGPEWANRGLASPSERVQQDTGRPADPRDVWPHKIEVAESGCWIWTGHVGRNGYGKVTRFGRHAQLAHRVVWRLVHGPIPEGVLILHRCDVRCCVNPEHLFSGSQADNVADMRAKGRNNEWGWNRRKAAV